MIRTSLKYLLFLAIVAGATSPVFGQFSLFSGGKKVEADPKKEYVLRESDGNWFIMTKQFSGDDARRQANRLVYELRGKYKLPAFVYKRDADQEEMDALSQRFGGTKKFRYQTERSVEYAVLVGGYATVDSPDLEKTLLDVARMKPESLKNDPKAKIVEQRYQEMARTDKKYAGYGPLGNAFPTRNPLLPKEFFSQKGVVDPFVAKLNSDSKYSLLNNPKMYTVRIATFTGDSNMRKDADKEVALEARLQYAGMQAAALCEALRNKGVEAWEFHDRDSSFVTIGSFDEYGAIQPDGHTELNPKVAAIMKKYGGKLCEDGSGQYEVYSLEVEINDPASTGLAKKKKKLSLACDVRPVIIFVPQRSGEENVRKLAAAQAKMEKAKREIVENAFERSLEAADGNLQQAGLYANSFDDQTIDEATFRRTLEAAQRAQNGGAQNAQAAQTAQSTQNPQFLQNVQTPRTAATTAPYAAPSTRNPQTAQNAQAPRTAQNGQAVRVAQNPQTAQNAASTAPYRRPTAQNGQATQNPQVAQNQAARPVAQAPQTAQNQATRRAYNAAAPVRSAQKQAAPTY